MFITESFIRLGQGGFPRREVIGGSERGESRAEGKANSRMPIEIHQSRE